MKDILITVLAIVVIFTGTASAEVFLKKDMAIDSAYISLSDIFEGIEEDADVRIMPSPDPAKSMTFDTATLSSIARRHKVNWSPASDFDRITVSRTYQTVGIEEILETLKKESGLSENDVMETKMSLSVSIPAGVKYSIRVNECTVDQKNKVFRADISIMDGDRVLEYVRPVGKIFSLVDVPVLKRNMSAGITITRDDIDFTQVRSDTLKQKDIVDESMLIGKETKKSLKPYKVISSEEVKAPVLVVKSKMVNVVFKKKNMTLSAVAKALDSGGMGDVVRFQTTGSKNVMQGVVIEKNTVAVGMEMAYGERNGI